MPYCAVILLLVLAYLLGSIPSAVWISRRYFGVDIRQLGSKNAGATNMLRVFGMRAALPVFAIDSLKGFVAVTAMGILRLYPEVTGSWIISLKIFAVIVVVIGHIFPIFASFKGGKGVSTLVGAITGIVPQLALLCFAVWVAIFVFTHYVSLASMVAGISFPIFVSLFSAMHYYQDGQISWLFIVFSVAVAVLLVWTHRANIARLRSGTEPKTYMWEKK